jgi:hypothetical protein
MARLARSELADMRAMEEQLNRTQMHSGRDQLSYSNITGGAHFIGAGATPSMGLSQFRGGGRRRRCPNCKCLDCCCQTGGAISLSGLSRSFGNIFRGRPSVPVAPRGPVVPAGPTVSTSTAMVPYNPAQAALPGIRAALAARQAAAEAAEAAAAAGRGPLAVRNPGTLAVYDEAAAAAAIRANPSKARADISARLSRMGITPGRVAAALAAGVGLAGLITYFSAPSAPSGPSDSGYYEPPETTIGHPDPTGPEGPGGTVTHGDPYPETGGPGGLLPPLGEPGGFLPPPPPGLKKPELAWYLQSGNLPDRYRQRRRVMGSGRGVRHNPRAAIVRKVMREQGLSMPAASSFVKQNGLY